MEQYFNGINETEFYFYCILYIYDINKLIKPMLHYIKNIESVTGNFQISGSIRFEFPAEFRKIRIPIWSEIRLETEKKWKKVKIRTLV